MRAGPNQGKEEGTEASSQGDPNGGSCRESRGPKAGSRGVKVGQPWRYVSSWGMGVAGICVRSRMKADGGPRDSEMGRPIVGGGE